MLIIVAVFLLQLVIVQTTDERRENLSILKFGQTENDYVMFQHDMSEFETGFTLCTWVRKLYSKSSPTWFSYAVSNSNYEIQVSDDGSQTYFLDDTSTSLTSLYTVTPGTWFHNCLSWDRATSTRDVYIDGVKVDSKATPAGRTLGQGGTIVLGNEQDSGPGLGMDSADIFGGELYKLNMFTRKLNDSEIKEMALDMCSEVEIKYGDERGLKWEDVLQKTKYGNVIEKFLDSTNILHNVFNIVQDMSMELDASSEKLNNTILQLSSDLNNTILQLSSDLNDTILKGKAVAIETNNVTQNSISELNSVVKELSSNAQGEIQTVREKAQEISNRKCV